MKLTRDPRAQAFADLLTPDINTSPIAWTGDQHYRAVFKPAGNADTPVLGIYPAGSPCDQSFVAMFKQVAEQLAADDGPAMYEVPFSGFTDHRGMEASGQGFSNSYKFTTAWCVQGTIGLMTPYGVVAGGGCDKTYPMLIHTMGIEPYRYMPWALLHAGHRSVGQLPDGREVTLADLASAKHRQMNGEDVEGEVTLLQQHVVVDEGVCENLASAMSQYIALVCAGFVLAADDLHASHHEGRAQHTSRTMALYREALANRVVPADVISADNFTNFVRAIALFGLSTNLPLHLPWMAKSWGVSLNPGSIWETMQEMPWIANLQPIGKYTVNHIGSMLPSYIKYLVAEGVLNDVTTLYGRRLSEVYADAPDMDFENQDVFFPVDAPMAASPQVVLYRGNLCPGGAWVKEGAAMRESADYIIKRYESQADFFKSTNNATQLKSGTCYVITGDKSTVELLSANIAINVAMTNDQSLDVALLTDQRTSGFAGTRAKAAYHLPRNRLRTLRTGQHVRFNPERRSIDRIDEFGKLMTAEMDELANNYREPDWPATGTIKDLVNRHLSDAEDGAAVG